MNIEVRISKYDKHILALKTESSIIILSFLLRSNLDKMLNNYIITGKAKSYIIVERFTTDYEIITRLIKVFLED